MATSTRLSWFFTVLGACAGSGEPPRPGSDAAVELGTGTTAFEPLAEGADIVLVTGPQGGHHFVVHARMRGLVPGDPTMPGLVGNPSTRFTVRDESGAAINVDMAPYRLGYEPDGDDYVLPGGRIAQVVEAAVPDLYGMRVRIGVEVTDSEGDSASDERQVTAIQPPGDAPGVR